MSKLVSFRRYAKTRLTSANTRKQPITERTNTENTPRIRRKPIHIVLGRIRRRFRRSFKEFAGNGMILTTKILFKKIELHGLAEFSFAPSAVLACSHKRSSDIPVTIPWIYLWKKPHRLKEFHTVYEVTREDLFEAGFLINFFPKLDKYRKFLSKINLSWLFEAVQAKPIKTPDEQTANQLLHEVKRLYGNLLASEALSLEYCERIFGKKVNDPSLTLHDAILEAPIEMLQEFVTPEIFNEPIAASMRKRHRETIIKQLRDMSRMLDKGDIIFIHPEGEVTPNGNYGKMKAALSRLVQNSRAEVKLVPINVTYDFMDTQRTKVIVNIGQAIHNANQLSKTELVAAIDKAIPALGCVTLSGLASRTLLKLAEANQELVRRFQLRDMIWEDLTQLFSTKLLIDNQIVTRQNFEERFNRFLQYCLKRTDILTNPFNLSSPSIDYLHVGDEWFTLNIAALLRLDCGDFNDHPVRYCYNELGSVLEAHNLEGIAIKTTLFEAEIITGQDQRSAV